MSETLNDLKRQIGRKQTATDIVTPSATLKPLAEGREAMLWATTSDQKLAVTATAKFA
jgi:hypothetical protein